MNKKKMAVIIVDDQKTKKGEYIPCIVKEDPSEKVTVQASGYSYRYVQLRPEGTPKACPLF